MKSEHPAQQPYDTIRALFRAGRNDEAIVVTQPDDLVAKELLFDEFYQVVR